MALWRWRVVPTQRSKFPVSARLVSPPFLRPSVPRADTQPLPPRFTPSAWCLSAELVRLPHASTAEKQWLRRHRKAQYSAKVDVWALGALIFELLHGTALFNAGTSEEKERAITAAGPVSIPPVTRAGAQLSPGALSFLQVSWEVELFAHRCHQNSRSCEV